MKLSLIAIGFILSTNAFGQTIELGEIDSGGTGCPGGTAEAPRMISDTEFVVPLQFIVETGFSNNKRIDRKSCNLSIPFHLEDGYSVAMVAAPKGFVDVEDSSILKVQYEIFFAGGQGPVFSKTFEGPITERFSPRDFNNTNPVVWSPCGVSAGTLRINLSAIAQGTSFGALENLRVKVLVRSCDSF